VEGPGTSRAGRHRPLGNHYSIPGCGAPLRRGPPPSDGRGNTPSLQEPPHPFSSLKGEAYAYLTDPKYGPLQLRLENAHAAVEAATVEARRRVRLNEGR